MGGKSAPAPDYSGMESVAREQLRFSQQQYADMLPIGQRVADQQIAAQEQQMRQAQDYYDYQMNTFRPLEQGLVAQAQNFNTDAYRQQQAQQASAAAARAFGTARESSARSQAARGVNPNSGAARGAGNNLILQEAAMRAGSMTGARQQAEQLGYARQLDAAGLGRGLAGASAAAYGGAVGAGSAGLGSAMAAGSQYQQGLAGAGQSYGQILGTQANVYNNAMNARGAAIGGLVGAGAGLVGAGWGAGLWGGTAPGTSDRRLKKNIKRVGKDERTGLNLYHFTYKDDPENRRFEGVMADEAREYMPDAVVRGEDGFDRVHYSMLGIEMKEIRG
jgi:hypothetical protein